MKLLGLFSLIALALDAVAVFICSFVEKHSDTASLLVFLGLFVVNFVIAWKIALWLTEKYLVSDAQKKADEEHVKWVNSLFAPAR
ncbi:MAG: hypothetical protein AB1490_02885 [Pseudomonadota bacterium]